MQVRILGQGVAKDYDAFCAFMRSQGTLLEETEPGTLLFEVFADPDSARVTIHEVYADADAFVEHTEALMGSSERLTRFMEVYELKRMTFLSDAEDERVRRAAEMMRATLMRPVVSFDRR